MKTEERRDREQQTICGTPNYLAPYIRSIGGILIFREVILKRPYGKAADLWSLGCLLYTIVVGRPPFESADIRDTFSKVSRGDFNIPSTVSSEARDLISRLIVLDPSNRLDLEQVRRHPFLCPFPPPSSRPFPPPPSPRPTVPLFVRDPLSTKYCKPVQQRTRHGWVQILGDGRLVVDFSADEDVHVISMDGRLVEVYKKPWNPFEYNHPMNEYIYNDGMSSKVLTRYEYGRRFVNLVRSKTPQICLVTDSLKAFLMCNPAPHDFQVRYVHGARVDYSPSIKQVVLRKQNGTERVLRDLSTAAIQMLSPIEDRLLVAECMARYKQCCETCLRISAIRDTLPFPYVIKEGATLTVGEITIPQISSLISTSMASMPRAVAPEGEGSFEYAFKTYLPNVGWCLASSAEQFLLLFTDGQTVLIDGRKNQVAFHDRSRADSSSRSDWQDINQHLPLELKQKLLHFPKFVNLLKNGNGHSFVS